MAEFRGVAKSYGDTRVFEGVSFIINRGDRVGLVGVNGAGKSTLIKLLAGAEAATAGECRLGHNVSADYFAEFDAIFLTIARTNLRSLSFRLVE